MNMVSEPVQIMSSFTISPPKGLDNWPRCTYQKTCTIKKIIYHEKSTHFLQIHVQILKNYKLVIIKLKMQILNPST